MSETEQEKTTEPEIELQLHQMTSLTGAIRKLGSDAETMEQAAQRIIDYLYDELNDRASGEKLCGLVRLFKTHAFGDLEEGLQSWAKNLAGQNEVAPGTKCLTLMATRGEQPDWNDRRASGGHKAIPLLSEQMVGTIPMISQLLKQLGLEVKMVLNPDPEFILKAGEHSFNVFYVASALGSPYIPAQDEFVKPAGIKSVIGYGGILPTGDLFVVIIFMKRAISRRNAELFQPLALSTKLALLPFIHKRTFGNG